MIKILAGVSILIWGVRHFFYLPGLTSSDVDQTNTSAPVLYPTLVSPNHHHPSYQPQKQQQQQQQQQKAVPPVLNKPIAAQDRAKGVIVILARNSNLHGVRASLRQFEARINHRFHYPYVFLNEEPFTDEFKHYVNLLVSSPTQFGLIPTDEMHPAAEWMRNGTETSSPAKWWGYPEHIDQERAKASREAMAGLENAPPYAGQ
jgi:hypothetical protein